MYLILKQQIKLLLIKCIHLVILSTKDVLKDKAIFNYFPYL